MNEQTRRLRTGIFLCTGILVVIVILFFLSGRDLLTTKVKVRTYFPESVQGLSRGAAVKYRGAPIGTVSKISILFSKHIVQVDMEIDISSFASESEEDFEAEFIQEVRNGLRCRLEYLGITGLKFIDFDYFSPSAGTGDYLPTPPEFIGDPDAIYVPSVPSTFTDIYASIARAIEKIDRINIDEISSDVSKALGEVVTLLSDPALKSAIGRINEAAANLESSSSTINRALDEKRLTQFLDSLDSSVKNLDSFITQINRDTQKANLPESAAAFRAASGAVIEGKQELSNTMMKLNQTIDSLRMLIEQLEEDPSSLVSGKKTKAD